MAVGCLHIGLREGGEISFILDVTPFCRQVILNIV